MNKKILIICYNPLSKSNSNGRTLQNLLKFVPSKNIAQLYFEQTYPSKESAVENFYRITDKDALKSLFSRKVGNVIKRDSEKNSGNKVGFYSSLGVNRLNPFYRMLRNSVWFLGRWQNRKMWNWIASFNPNMVFLMSGNNFFSDSVALKIAKKFTIPLVVYNCEDYYLKPRPKTLIRMINKSISDKYFLKIMHKSSLTIYNSEMLQTSFSNVFNHKSVVIYNSSDILPRISNQKDKCTKVSYIGNISNARFEPLIEIAEILFEEGLFLDVYGNIQNNEARLMFEKSLSIRYHGFVDYETSLNVLKESDIIVHAENFRDNRQVDLKHAFSTKVADTLALGKCFLLYAPRGLAITEYLKKENAACVVSEKDNLKSILTELVNSKEKRIFFSNGAYKTALKNHLFDIASQKFIDSIKDII